MEDINDRILQKLKKYDKETSKLAILALELSVNEGESFVIEHLKIKIREVVKKRGGADASRKA